MRRAVLWASLVGNNLPDIDFVIPSLVARSRESSKIEYLLHHRGHTHTVLVSVLLALLLAWCVARVHGITSRNDRGRVFAAGVLGGLLHLFADSWNNYGVHPFWPLSSRWLYGDSLFIVEPLLIFALAPLALAELRSKIGRATIAVFCTLVFALIWFSGYVAPAAAGVATLWLALHAGAQWRLRSAWPAAIGAAIVLGTFWMAGRASRAELMTQGQVDLIQTPSPANPFCWRFLSVETGAGESSDRYRVRMGGLSLAPHLMGEAMRDPARCGYPLRSERTAPLDPVTDTAGFSTVRPIAITGQYTASMSEMRTMASENCRFAGALGFFRAPYWAGNGEARIAGDLRYDREQGLGFSELSLSGECPRWTMPWIPPRNELLQGPGPS